jgi:protein-tyrosine phosphatase
VNEIRPWLYIGKFRDTGDLELLHAYQIGAMLQLAEWVKQPGIDTLFLPIEDGEPLPVQQLEQGVSFVCGHKALGRKVLIACGAGISRSVTFGIAALKEEEGLSLPDAFRAIYTHHRAAMPHFALWNSLCQYYGEGMSYEDLWEYVRFMDRL